MKLLGLMMNSKLFIFIFFGFVTCVFSTSSFAQTPAELVRLCQSDALSQKEQIKCLERSLLTLGSGASRPTETIHTTLNGGEGDDAGKASVTSGTPEAAIELESDYKNKITKRERDIGIEQLSELSRDVKFQHVKSQVVDYAYDNNGKILVILANGQAWKQRRGDLGKVKLRHGDAPAITLRKGVFSGYRMEFPDLERTIVVSRIR